MSHYPKTRGFTGTLRPVRLEGDIRDLELEGDVPSQLDGTFHRVHPDAQFAPRFEDDQFFNGDGMVTLFRFQDGRIDFRQRYAQTDKWMLEREAGRSLFGQYRNPLTDDDRYAGRPYRHGWMLVMDPDMPFEGGNGRMSGFVMNKIAHVDLQTGRQVAWWAGPQSICQEPCFIPRYKGAAEGDGYLIALVDNLVTNYSDLVVLDALKLSEGPIARAKLPIRLRSGLHGNWADASQLPI